VSQKGSLWRRISLTGLTLLLLAVGYFVSAPIIAALIVPYVLANHPAAMPVVNAAWEPASIYCRTPGIPGSRWYDRYVTWSCAKVNHFRKVSP